MHVLPSVGKQFFKVLLRTKRDRWSPPAPADWLHWYIPGRRRESAVLICAFVQSRRRLEKWTRTGKWDSRGSVTADFVCVCTLFGFHVFSQDDGGG